MIKTERLIVTSLALITCLGCATPKYVLHWRAPTKLSNFLSPPKEASPILGASGVVLLYDRSRWVVEETALDDGSVWVHYAIQIKNSSESAVRPLISQAHLESIKGSRADATLEEVDKSDGCNSLSAKTLCRVEVKFHLPGPMVATLGGSSEPLSLMVPVQGLGELKQAVWLWRD